MTVSYYQWGMLQGGIDPATGVPAVITAAGGGVSGPPEQFSGTLGAGTTTLSFSETTRGVSIRNTSDSDALQYSFDNATWFNCAAYQVVQEGVETDFVYLKAAAGAPTYEVLGILSA